MFSVVIPLYNKELSIRNTIQSILDQTFQKFEIVIVNDGSTDSSTKVIEEINDERIRLIHQENKGVSTARNRGIEEARFEWIAFLDGDDLWRENHLAEITKMMKVYPKEKVYATSYEYSDNRVMFKHPRSTTIFKVEDYFAESIKESLIWTSIAVIHKTCFKKVGAFNEQFSIGEDIDLWIRLAKVYKLVKSAEVTAIYRVDSENKLSMGKSKLKDSMFSTLSLKGMKGSERAYYKEILIVRLKNDVVRFKIWEIIQLLWKHNFELLK
ncbi:glycosyltransferase family 2 protein [Gelidibacter japonicus]|uniref:glycosyltransferase family 2 protein n=1 Tax=Gelidibacter japonicus TaxID=1962232 RepID=UPI003A94D67C